MNDLSQDAKAASEPLEKAAGYEGARDLRSSTVLVPPRLYHLFANRPVQSDFYIPNDCVYVIDEDGHVHVLNYVGRLIDSAPPS